jgi:outer membrane lipoprotein LolB
MAFAAALASRVALLLAAGVVAGCATTPTDGPGSTVSGRLSLQVEAFEERPAHNLSAAFDLSGTAERGSLQLASPLGLTLAEAHWRDGEFVRLVTREGEKRFPDLETMSRQALGEALPLRALPDWLRGRPWPGAPSLAEGGRGGFEQLGWQVDLTRFGDGFWLARRAAAPAVVMRVRLLDPAD